MQNSVVQWLEYTARRSPEKTAFVDEKGSYTWAEVRRNVLSIAKQIEKTIPGGKQPVAVYMEKSADMLLAYLGIAYSGCFYSPIATDMPPVRVEKILNTLQPTMFIVTRDIKEQIGKGKKIDFCGSILCFEDIINEVNENSVLSSGNFVEDDDASRFVDRILDTDLLYVLFTSGSTGMPKGVAVTHRSVVDYIDWVVEQFDITEKDSIGNQAPFYFDNSILDIYSSVKTGAELHIISEDLFHQIPQLLQYLADNKISTIFWVPSALSQVAWSKALETVDLTKTLKRILFCGEVMHNKTLNLWRRHLPNVQYANLYGPTEITDACTYYIVDRPFSDDEPLPIGRPMRNTEILVLDDQDRLVTEPDIVGELCVRGTCLAAGYYNDPERTAQAFIQNPLQKAYEEKIYRTGDLVKYNEYHELIYLSRKDFQIKHLAHRIELGEIETAASSIDGVASCCCLYNPMYDFIVLFLEGKSYTSSEINKKLATLLPRYMLPSLVICLDSLPLNANGKIDRVRLKEKYIN